MPSAVIQSEVNSGSYIVKIDHDVERSKTLKSKLSKLETATGDLITDLEDERDTALLTTTAKQSALNTAINILNFAIAIGDPLDVASAFKLVAFRTTELQKVLTSIKVIDIKLANSKLLLAGYSTEKKLMQSAIDKYDDPTTVTVPAVAFETGRTGTVDILYLEDEPEDVSARIAPTGHTVSRDIQPVESSGAYGIAYNLSVMPGYQKWKPQYKQAIATNINTTLDTCTVTFSVATSAIKGYDGTPYTTIAGGTVMNNVPIEYLSSNAEAFVENDRVVVSFSGDLATPKVIGFVRNPALKAIDAVWEELYTSLGPQGFGPVSEIVGLSMSLDNDVIVSWLTHSLEIELLDNVVNGTLSGSRIAFWLDPVSTPSYGGFADVQPIGGKGIMQIELQTNIAFPPNDQFILPGYIVILKKGGILLDAVTIDWWATDSSNDVTISSSLTGEFFPRTANTSGSGQDIILGVDFTPVVYMTYISTSLDNQYNSSTVTIMPGQNTSGLTLDLAVYRTSPTANPVDVTQPGAVTGTGGVTVSAFVLAPIIGTFFSYTAVVTIPAGLYSFDLNYFFHTTQSPGQRLDAHFRLGACYVRVERLL